MEKKELRKSKPTEDFTAETKVLSFKLTVSLQIQIFPILVCLGFILF